MAKLRSKLGRAEPYDTQRAGPDAPTTRASEMIKRLRTAAVSM